ncbi:hypothetical protein C5167_018332 [Papaver somniferum]|uniref:Uncharacterized protein n=1 Tax=Papaver somniferum TaxID=3469 RepID=A0A4Y7ILZ5_PAPSO|nr:hypothetical protein C5167_018332 [Papaver somniferum]
MKESYSYMVPFRSNSILYKCTTRIERSRTIEAKEKDQVDAILKILVGAEPKNSFSSFSIGVKDNPLKQPGA